MQPIEPGAQEVRNQLDRILGSPGFARNERLSRFLEFIVERRLAGKEHELKESVIGVEVLGRSPDYNPKQDPIVRTEATRLRARLSEYYLGEGKNDALIIELPKGGYSPAFRLAAITPAPPALESSSQATPKRIVWLALALVLLTAAGVLTWRMHSRNAPVTIGVLPLINVSQEPFYDAFADGFTGEIIRNLSILEGLTVRSQTSSFALKGKPRNVREAGKLLAVDYILEGSVLRVGRQLRVNIQFIRVRDDLPLWSGRYDRELTDVFAIQDEISRGIVNSLRLKLGRGRRRYETNAETYELYLRARAMQIQTGLRGLDQSAPLLEQAVARDQGFAPAYGALAAAYGARSGQFAFDIYAETAKLRAAAEKAIQLDPLLAEAHDGLGIAYAREGQWERAEKSFRRALELDPTRCEHFTLDLLLPLGRYDEAIRYLRVAEKADPVSPLIRYCLGYVMLAARRFEEAVDYFQKVPADFSTRSSFLGRALLGQGKMDEALRIFEANSGEYHRSGRGFIYARQGRREEAEKIAAQASNGVFSSLVFAGLGDKERTLEALESMAPLGPVRMGRTLTFPEYDLLRGDPRLRILRKKVGLPE